MEKTAVERGEAGGGRGRRDYFNNYLYFSGEYYEQ